MAKIRVYELAKKLNMTNRALLLKLEAMNIEVKSHMSSLEDDTVAQIKETLFGKNERKADTRVKPSVIRRRKKSKKKQQSDEADVAGADNDGLEMSDSDRAEVAKSVADAVDEDKTAESVEETGETVDADPQADIETEKENVAVEKALTVDDTASSEAKNEKENLEPVSSKSVGKKLKNKKPAKSAKIIKPASSTETTAIAESTDAETSDTADIADDVDQNKGVLDSEAAEPLKTDAVEEDAPQVSVAEETSSASPTIQSNGEDGKTDTGADSALKASDSPEEAAGPVDSKTNSVEDENIKEADMPKELEKEHPVESVSGADAPVADSDAEKTSPKPVDHPEHAVATDKKSDSDTEESAVADKKKKRKKKHKKSEPAKIIKLAIPLPVQPKRTASAEKTPSAGGGRPSRFNGPGSGGAGAPSLKRHPSHAAAVAPLPPTDADDAKSKRKKGKGKKKKRGDELGTAEMAAKGSPKKRKSVVEGKDLYDRGYSGKKGRRKDGRGGKKAKAQKTQITMPKAIKRRIKIDETIELSELAKRMSIKANEMIVKLMGMGVMATVNQTIDFDTAVLVAAEFDYEVERAAAVEDVLIHVHDEEAPENLIERPPVVTIMGHVDHGKTSLLDVIRKSKITTGEAGGITQHIGAYSVETPGGGQVTFLDTPGHEAFTSMRSRGAQVTDIVVLVVAADDGVMPQTIEAINHSKAAEVPVVVAVNKMDKPDADPDRVTRELAEHGLLSEDWGGDVIFAQVSAKTEMGIDHLLEMILLQAEVLELKANPNRLAVGHVVEARLDAGRGPVATVLVQQGTLKASEPVVCGLHSGKIRTMIGDMGQTIDSAGPSTPVEIMGMNGVPEAGDEFVALASEKDAKQISENRMQKERAKELAKKSRANLEKLFANMGADEIKELKLLLKADVHGSLEALNESLMKLVQEEVDIKIVHSGIGAINESDVSLAAVSDAIIIGFNVRPTPKVRELAKEENVDMRFYDIIYNVINDIKAALTGLMPSTFHENILGRAEVRDTFVIPSRGTIAGCFVQDGKVTRGEKIRLLREGVVKCDSIISSLRRFKDDAKEVSQGYECGIGIEKYNDIKVGDVIECYEIEERKASIDSLKE